jgi:hypothetical protein
MKRVYAVWLGRIWVRVVEYHEHLALVEFPGELWPDAVVEVEDLELKEGL